jgi:asparagine synthase (glutamine-hydrolysing)
MRLMCGISGLYSLDAASAVDPQALARMSAALAHRGPDGTGTFRDGPVGLTARRLAIVDVAGGDQPLASEDGRVRLVCNGEIYNHRELRRRLERRGHVFRSGSDCEVAVHLYEELGLGFAGELRGMFALALWDRAQRRLVLARDRFGIKPLLYARDGRRLAFASELRALTVLPDVSREIDLAALGTYLTVNAVMGERTMLGAVRRLRPGHLMIAEHGGSRLWRYARDLPAGRGEEREEPVSVLAEEAKDRLGRSVTDHLQADVEVGVLLSGGIDSGLVAALAARRVAGRLKTFSVGFTEAAFDERPLARSIARRYGTDHSELFVGPEAADELADVARAFDEPRGDSTALPYWLLARLASRSVKVALSGEGGDELFGGYQTYQADVLGAAAARAAALMTPLVRAWPASAARLSLDFRLRRLARGAGLQPLERHHAWKEIFSGPERERLLAAGRHSAADPLAEHRLRYAETEGADPLARFQDVDIGTFLADDLLPQADRAGMAHGLEIRVPFLDPQVAELALALPRRAKVTAWRSKRVLRVAGASLLPDPVVRGPKRGFCTPAAAWLRGPLLPLASDVLAGETLARQGYFRPRAVHALLARHVARREDLSRPLWALIAFTLWHDAHIAAAPAAPLEAAA